MSASLALGKFIVSPLQTALGLELLVSMTVFWMLFGIWREDLCYQYSLLILRMIESGIGPRCSSVDEVVTKKKEKAVMPEIFTSSLSS
jgi:hypothetical protein